MPSDFILLLVAFKEIVQKNAFIQYIQVCVNGTRTNEVLIG